MLKTWITSAHQGFVKGNVRSNTLLAVQFAIEKGAEMIETDARMTKDGVLVANHDETVVGVNEKGERVEKEIISSTFAELKEIILSKNEYGTQYIATLDEIFKVANRGGISVNVDLKEGFKNAENIARMAMNNEMSGKTIYAPNGSGLKTIFAILKIDEKARFIDTPNNFNEKTLSEYADYKTRCYAYTADFSKENIKAIRDSGCMLATIGLNSETAPVALALSPDMAEYPHTSDFEKIEKNFFRPC